MATGKVSSIENTHPKFRELPETPIVCWKSDDKRIHFIHGKLKPDSNGVLTIHCQHYGQHDSIPKTYNVTSEKKLTVNTVSGIELHRDEVQLTRTGFRGVLAYFFGVGGDLSKAIADRINNAGQHFFTVIWDEKNGVIDNVESLDLIAPTDEFVTVLVKYKQSQEFEYRTYKIEKKESDSIDGGGKILKYHLNDVDTLQDDFKELIGQERPIIDDLEVYINNRFGHYERPDKLFFVVLWNPETNSPVGSENEKKLTGDERTFPICIKNISTGECCVRIYRAEIRSGRSTGSKKYHLDDITILRTVFN